MKEGGEGRGGGGGGGYDTQFPCYDAQDTCNTTFTNTLYFLLTNHFRAISKTLEAGQILHTIATYITKMKMTHKKKIPGINSRGK